jgi:hypothetical protein
MEGSPMRMLKLTLWSLVLISTSMAQAPAGHEKAPGVSVIKTGWVAVGVGRQEAEAAIIRGEQVGTRGGIEPTSFRTPVDQADASVAVKNVGQTAIKAIRLELVFIDAQNKKELLRYRLSSKTGFGPGETVTLSKRVNEPNKGYYYVPGTDRKQVIPRTFAATRQVVVTRVEYADGTVWHL